MTTSTEPTRASSTSIPVTEASQVGEARRVVATACRELGLGETDSGRAGILVTEAATNIVRHAGSGEILVQPLVQGTGLEIIALDRGPGIGDMALAFEDGHSTRGTPGTGLGAMRRLASRFEVHSARGEGTAILMQVWESEPPRSWMTVGAVCLAKPGEEECGDAWALSLHDGGSRLVVADGLGHGPLAREAALVIVGAALQAPPGPARAVEDAHLAARSTRGAALAVAEAERGTGLLRYAGCGNIAAALLAGGASRHLVSMNGTVGQGVVKGREFSYPFAAGTTLVLVSDGLASSWSSESYRGHESRHPALLAALLYRDHSRRRDDVTVVVARFGGQP